jgi:hypothetical protein
MSDAGPPDLKKAFFSIEGQDGRVALDFNPASLQLTVQNQTKAEGEQKVQFVTSSTAKLDLELIFDSTDTGEDVRSRSKPVELMMKPVPIAGDTNNAKTPRGSPPVVKFEWGSFVFSGFVESFKQVLDFFSDKGVPLRAIVTLSLSQPNYVFDQLQSPSSAKVDDTLDLSGGDPSSLAAAGGDPSAARVIAALNGLESLRATAGGSISVGGGISIGAAAGFSASAGAGGGLAAGAGLNLGVSAGAAFAGLQAGGAAIPGAGKAFDSGKILAVAAAPAVSAGATFDVSGKASVAGGSSFKADVSGGVEFDEV